MFFVNLKTDVVFKRFLLQEQDDLLHWQYVQKKESYLVKLPVDFDLITIFLFMSDKEEFVLNLELIYNNSNCEENFSEALRTVRNLLWNDLFHNSSDFYLCNIHFQDQHLREALYWITTIWVGYDLKCSEIAVENGKPHISMLNMEKDLMPFVISLFCFCLSLYFVWIFVLLDIHEKQITESFDYKKDDRPYGVKRTILKFFYKECTGTSNSEPSEKSLRRLICLTCVILCVGGAYRTFARYLLNLHIYKSYSEVIKPSESMFSFMGSDGTIFALDFIYATFFPLFFVCFGHGLYIEFMDPATVFFCSTCKTKKEAYESFGDTDSNNTRFSDTNSNDTRITDTNSNNARFSNSFVELGHKFVTCEYKKKEDNIRCSSFCVAFVTTIVRMVCCFFPILPFCYPNHVCKDSSCTFSYASVFCLRHVLTKIILYFVCFRPIISTCTFLIRSFTYFVFVALFLRIHLMRFAIIIVSTLIYCTKYLTEIVNSYAAILSFIFERCTCNDTIKETKFDEICGKLTFMHKKIYFILVKILIVFMYLIITIGTFTKNREALIGTDVQSIVGILVVIISPYAASLFLKSGNGDYLSDQDKTEIDTAYAIVFGVNTIQSDENVVNTTDVRTQNGPSTAVVETHSGDPLNSALKNVTTIYTYSPISASRL